MLRICTVCGEQEKSQISLASHDFGEWEITQAATCVQEGVQTRQCTVCGFTEEGITDLADHTYGEWIIVQKATCTTAGIERRICSVCGVAEENTTGMADHIFVWTTVQAATCTSQGSRAGICSGCGATKTEEIAASSHDWSEATCKTPKTCKLCGVSEGGTAEHSWKAATCTQAKTCSVCGITEGSALGHSYGSSGTCSSCGNKMVSIVLKIPTVGGNNAYAYLNVTNYTDSTITFPQILNINGKVCNSDGEYQLAAGCSAKLTYYRAIIPSQRYESKSYDMYLDNNSIGYSVMTWNGTQYYAEYGVNGITEFYRGNVNGPA